jgi:hypothetical protein
MSIEIQDQNGIKVTDLDAGKSKGINIVEWNFLTKPPKLATGKTFAFGGFTSPRVSAGTYKVVIQKGKDTYTSTLEVQYDPKSPIALADRKLNEATTKKLFDMSQELAYIVYELDETVAAAEAQKAKIPSSAKTVTPLINELTKLKEKLVITTGDNYVGMGEPQLREDMADLYSKVAQSHFRPSQAELDNLDALEERFASAKVEFKKIKDKHLAKFTEVRTKNKLEPIVIKSYDEFLKGQ